MGVLAARVTRPPISTIENFVALVCKATPENFPQPMKSRSLDSGRCGLIKLVLKNAILFFLQNFRTLGSKESEKKERGEKNVI